MIIRSLLLSYCSPEKNKHIIHRFLSLSLYVYICLSSRYLFLLSVTVPFTSMAEKQVIAQ